MTSSRTDAASLCDDSHEHYIELCALATSGTLSEREWSELKAHLAICLKCRDEIQQYREVARTGMALLMPESSGEPLSVHESWSPESAKDELFQRIARGETEVEYRQRVTVERGERMSRLERWFPMRTLHSKHAFAFAIIVCAILAAGTYRWEKRKAYDRLNSQLASTTAAGNLLRKQLDEPNKKPASTGNDLGARSADLDLLEIKLKHQGAEVARWKELQARTADELKNRTQTAASLQSDLSARLVERDEIGRRLQAAEVELRKAQLRYDDLRQQRSQELLRAGSLERQINELTAVVQEFEAKTRQNEEFLARDRDIRDLMGARELHIADVFDVDASGEKRKPYGRVFYTQGKSLIFYAFDLNQQEHLRNASYFQAWGRRGIGDHRPLNMGVFYLDSEANRRWILKFDDPQMLAQIDAVFVTIEPIKGGSRPSGKQLLFASLKTAANHP